MKHTDNDLIRRYIELRPDATSPTDARITDRGVDVWALIGHLRVNGDDVAVTAADYDLPPEAVKAARAYYHRNKAVIDARLTLHTAFFAVGA
jgi:uncharacterized protein (DUF433 family)